MVIDCFRLCRSDVHPQLPSHPYVASAQEILGKPIAIKYVRITMQERMLNMKVPVMFAGFHSIST